MGTDIHLFVEFRPKPGAPWKLADPGPAFTCDWCDGSGVSGDGETCYWCAGTKVARRFAERNYDLFGMLADVRNGRGFAGVRTGEGYEPIHAPRGRPGDLSPELREHLRRADEDDEDGTYFDECERRAGGPGHRIAFPGDHSASWATLAELRDYFARTGARASRHVGYIELDDVPAFLERGRPASWAGDVWGASVRKLTLGAARAVLDGREPRDAGAHYVVAVEWSTTYADDAGPTFMAFLDACEALAPGRPDDVRLVYDFDS